MLHIIYVYIKDVENNRHIIMKNNNHCIVLITNPTQWLMLKTIYNDNII